MKYKLPKFSARNVLLIGIFSFLLIQIFLKDKTYYELGVYEIVNKKDVQKIYIGVNEIDYIKITIEENYKNLRFDNCSLDKIRFIGNLRSATRMQVRIRVEDIETSKKSITEKKFEETEPTRNYNQKPIFWKTLDTNCKGEYLIVDFEEKIDLHFIEFEKLVTENNFVSSLPRLVSIVVGR